MVVVSMQQVMQKVDSCLRSIRYGPRLGLSWISRDAVYTVRVRHIGENQQSISYLIVIIIIIIKEKPL
jgi:hypothetical protein